MKQEQGIKNWVGELPERKKGSKYPFDKLGVGQYFEVPATNTAIYSLASSHSKKGGKQYVVKKDGDKLQVVRIKDMITETTE